MKSRLLVGMPPPAPCGWVVAKCQQQSLSSSSEPARTTYSPHSGAWVGQKGLDLGLGWWHPQPALFLLPCPNSRRGDTVLQETPVEEEEEFFFFPFLMICLFEHLCCVVVG